jgi:hypothetical protein
MKTVKDILNFIKGNKANEQGLIYSYEVINGEPVIIWAGVICNGDKPNIAIQFNGKSEIEVPHHKIDKALSDFIAIHGRQPFTIPMAYPKPTNEEYLKYSHFAENEDEIFD